ASLFLSRSGFFSLLFVVPFAFLAFRYGCQVVWRSLFYAVAVNTLLVIGSVLVQGFPPQGIFWDIVHFAVMAGVFAWIVSPLPDMRPRWGLTMRFAAGSAAASLLFVGMFFRAAASPGFLELMGEALAELVSRQSAAGLDVVQSAIMQELTPEMVVSFMSSAMLRGGALVFCALLFFFCSSVGFALARLCKNWGNKFIGKPEADLLQFFRVHPAMIWVLSATLLLLVVSSKAGFVAVQAVLWNGLALCGILYLAQGLGIVFFFLANRTGTPFVKLVLSMVFLLLLFSPGINAVLFGGVVLLGIAENWLPLRVSKIDGPPSTPGAGGTGS
ncbi:MAG: YybS family protein, partial [Treponema sp.]|nr:YybS family protein [Treponema sp.]